MSVHSIAVVHVYAQRQPAALSWPLTLFRLRLSGIPYYSHMHAATACMRPPRGADSVTTARSARAVLLRCAPAAGIVSLRRTVLPCLRPIYACVSRAVVNSCVVLPMANFPLHPAAAQSDLRDVVRY